MNNGKDFNNNKIIDSVVKNSGGKISREAAQKAASGDLDGLLNSLSDKDAAMLKAALSDEKKAKQLLSSDAAQKLINMLLGGDKGNG